MRDSPPRLRRTLRSISRPAFAPSMAFFFSSEFLGKATMRCVLDFILLGDRPADLADSEMICHLCLNVCGVLSQPYQPSPYLPTTSRALFAAIAPIYIGG